MTAAADAFLLAAEALEREAAELRRRAAEMRDATPLLTVKEIEFLGALTPRTASRLASQHGVKVRGRWLVAPGIFAREMSNFGKRRQ